MNGAIVGPIVTGPRVKGWLLEMHELLAEQHSDGKGQRIWSKYPHDAMGLGGELTFANAANCLPGSNHPLLEVRVFKDRWSDGGVDFWTWIGTIDVKTNVKAFNLLREVEKRQPADILVLGKFQPEPWAFSLLGWEYDSVMTSCPSGVFGTGPLSHYKPVDQLRPMAELLEALRTSEQPTP